MADFVDFKKYQEYLGEIPEFLVKYLELKILQRLKDISLLCGMDYASKDAYDFAFYISRFDHSLNVALITWRLTHSKEATLAALFHDVASPAFSHVIDFMNGDFLNQESTEEKTEEILRNSEELKILLEIDDIDIEDIIDFKQYSIVDLDRPCMCADRLDNIIAVGMAWVKTVDCELAKRIIDSIDVAVNEFGVEEISFDSEEIAQYVHLIYNEINELTHSNNDNYMMILTANMISRCLELELFTYDDLFMNGEHDIINKIMEAQGLDEELDKAWYEFKYVKDIPEIDSPPIKNKIVNPLVKSRRLEI